MAQKLEDFGFPKAPQINYAELMGVSPPKLTAGPRAGSVSGGSARAPIVKAPEPTFLTELLKGVGFGLQDEAKRMGLRKAEERAGAAEMMRQAIGMQEAGVDVPRELFHSLATTAHPRASGEVIDEFADSAKAIKSKSERAIEGRIKELSDPILMQKELDLARYEALVGKEYNISDKRVDDLIATSKDVAAATTKAAQNFLGGGSFLTKGMLDFNKDDPKAILEHIDRQFDPAQTDPRLVDENISKAYAQGANLKWAFTEVSNKLPSGAGQPGLEKWTKEDRKKLETKILNRLDTIEGVHGKMVAPIYTDREETRALLAAEYRAEAEVLRERLVPEKKLLEAQGRLTPTPSTDSLMEVFTGDFNGVEAPVYLDRMTGVFFQDQDGTSFALSETDQLRAGEYLTNQMRAGTAPTVSEPEPDYSTSYTSRRGI